jgi:hypothetical protein
MTDSDKNILDCLNNIKGNGSFVSSHKTAFVFPGIEVEGVGELSYPINEWQAKTLIEQARKAPFGKGSQTIFDDTVRNAWEIDAGMLRFKGNQWSVFVNKALNTIKPDLGIESYEISASLYKMLIYEEGSFFLPHKDSEKEKGMFGTLVICLPSKHSGGELAVWFDGQEKLVRFDGASDNYEIYYAAFYADCEHEIKPLISGYRICLVYNLIQNKTGKIIQAQPLGKHVEKLVTILKNDEENNNAIPKIILLGHQYTPENFSRKSLKLNDRAKTDALLRAAELAGYYSKMCLVTSYVIGSPAWEGYDDETDENAAMEEVYDETLSIEHWLNEGVPPLYDIQFEEKDLLAAFHLDDDEPIVKESSGYMGNYGPDLMHWYHYGAVMLWSKKMHEELLPQQNTANKLEWIAYYNKNRDRLSESEITLCEKILSGNLNGENYHPTPNYNVIADWLTGMNDESYFEKIGNKLLQDHFLKIDAESWTKLAESYPSKYLEKLFQQIAADADVRTMAHLMAILNVLSAKIACSGLVASLLKALPEYLKTLNKKGKPVVTAKSLQNILILENRMPQDETWVKTVVSILTSHKERNYTNTVLAPETTSLKNTPLAHEILMVCRDDLQNRVNNKPQPPDDWSRPVPDDPLHARQWRLLTTFMQSPDIQVFDYRKNQSERHELEHAIKSVEADLKTETIKKGSPHTLRITKTQDAYKKQMKQWNEDGALLEKVKQKLLL